MTSDTSELTIDRIDPEALRTVLREAVLVLAIGCIVVLGTVLPGAGRELPGTDVSVGQLVVAGGTLAVVATLAFAAPRVRALLSESLEGPSQVVADVAASGQYLVLFCAVLLAHQGLAGVVVPLLETPWVYDLVILVLALGVLVGLARRLLGLIDPVAVRATTIVLGDRAETERATESGEAD